MAETKSKSMVINRPDDITAEIDRWNKMRSDIGMDKLTYPDAYNLVVSKFISTEVKEVERAKEAMEKAKKTIFEKYLK